MGRGRLGGNLQTIMTNGAVSTTYQYGTNAPDELQSVSVGATPTVVSYGGYDANGDPGSITTTYLSYDNAGRLSAFYRGDGGTGVFSYNAQGQRTAFTWNLPGSGNTPSYTLGYQYRDGQLAQLSVSTLVSSVTPSATPTSIAPECNNNDGNGCTESFVYRQDGAPLELLYTPTGGATQRYWYVLDGKGNVVALTTASGAVVDRYAYDVWGVPTTISEQVPQPLLYGGYVYDRELSGPGDVTATGQPVGWYWLSVRHYDPSLKRFLQPDPSEQEGTMSYVYAGDDPLDATDPSGELGVCLGPLTLGNCSTNPSLTDVAVGVGIGVGVALVVAGTVATGGGLAVGLAGGEAFLGLDVATLTVAGPALVTAGSGVLTGDPAFGGVGGGGGDAAGAEAEAAGVFGARGVLPTDANEFGDSIGLASGRRFFPSSAGGPVRELSTSGVKITERGVDAVESHLARFEVDPSNAVMIERLRSIAAGEMDAEQVDLNFYTHELRESVRYRSLGYAAGQPAEMDASYALWNNAHTATLEDYGLSSAIEELYHPSAIE